MKPPLRPSLRKRLEKKAKKGFRGYPIGSLAFYGPDDRRASKMVASIAHGEREEDIGEMRKWFTTDYDVRNDETFAEEVWAFFDSHGVRSTMTGRSARNAPSGPIATTGPGRSSSDFGFVGSPSHSFKV